jgi:hypothetical protein
LCAILLLARAKACRPFQNRHSNEGCISPHRHSGEGRNRFCTSAFCTLASERRAFTLLRRARYLSFACPKEKYPRENDTPLGACRAFMPGKSVSRGRAFRQDSGNCSCVASTRASMPSPVLTKRSRHPCRLPSGPVVPASPPHRGPDRAAGHRGRTFQKSQSTGGAPPAP